MEISGRRTIVTVVNARVTGITIKPINEEGWGKVALRFILPADRKKGNEPLFVTLWLSTKDPERYARFDTEQPLYFDGSIILTGYSKQWGITARPVHRSWAIKGTESDYIDSLEEVNELEY